MNSSAKRIQWISIGVALLIAALAFWSGGITWGFSVLWGATIVTASFILWRWIARKLIERANGVSVWVIMVGVAKLVAIGILLWYTIMKTAVEPLAFLAGLSSIVAAIFLEGIIRVSTKET